MSRYRLFYHFVWATKNRLPIVTEANQSVIHRVIVDKTAKLGGIVHAINSVSDHIHLCVSLPPTISLSKYMNEVKGSSSHLVNHLHTPYSDKSFAWQESYGVVSVSESHLAQVVAYVLNQQKHHAEQGGLDGRLENVE